MKLFTKNKQPTNQLSELIHAINWGIVDKVRNLLQSNFAGKTFPKLLITDIGTEDNSFCIFEQSEYTLPNNINDIFELFYQPKIIGANGYYEHRVVVENLAGFTMAIINQDSMYEDIDKLFARYSNNKNAEVENLKELNRLRHTIENLNNELALLRESEGILLGVVSTNGVITPENLELKE